MQTLGENPIEASEIVVHEGCEPNTLIDFVARLQLQRETCEIV
ncbi:hypothetical protein [Bradyrhizobium lablabi]|nr:hypothetical protein [Bradyrhizobium lablabi]